MSTIAEPRLLREATELVVAADGDAKFLGGGTALVLLLRFGMINPETLVSLRGLTDVPGWNEIAQSDGALRIGGGVTLSRVAADAQVRELFPGLAHSAAVVGNTRIRNVATVGGLMAEADYASDPPAALVSLDASVQMSDGQTVRDIPAADFITDFYTTELGEGEVVTGVSIPVPKTPVHSVYLKFCSRSAEDRPCVGVAAAARLDDGEIASIRVAIGAVGGYPQLFPEHLEPMMGGRLEDSVIRRVAEGYAESVDPITDIRGSAWYRREVVHAQVGRALRALRDGCVP